MNKAIYKTILNKIKKSKNVAVFGHTSVDSDCVGSLSAISFLCQKFGKNCTAFVDFDKVSAKLEFLGFNYYNDDVDFEKFDLIISVDVASKRLLGKYKEGFLNHKNSICIDHHPSRDYEAVLNLVDTQKASCCEIMFDIIMQSKFKLESFFATCLYAGVADDTGCFVHDNTKSNTHFVAAKLIDCGADVSSVNYNLFKLQTAKQFAFKKVMQEKTVIENNLAYLVLTIDDFKKYNAEPTDVNNFIQDIINIENVKVAFTLVEKKRNLHSLSLRCLKGYDVSKIANIFGGGGHKQASGAQMAGTSAKSTKLIVEQCLKYLESEAKNV